MAEKLVIGAVQKPLQGPGVLTHEGGDPILVAELENGLPGTEASLHFEGEERVIDGDDEFHPSDPSKRSVEIEETVLVRALGQANASFAEKKPAKKEAKVAA